MHDKQFVRVQAPETWSGCGIYIVVGDGSMICITQASRQLNACLKLFMMAKHELLWH